MKKWNIINLIIGYFFKMIKNFFIKIYVYFITNRYILMYLPFFHNDNNQKDFYYREIRVSHNTWIVYRYTYDIILDKYWFVFIFIFGLQFFFFVVYIDYII